MNGNRNQIISEGKDKQVYREISNAGKSVEELNSLCDTLSARLTPVLGINALNSGAESKDTPRFSPLAENINAIGSGINLAIIKLSEILSRLEI